MSFFTAIECIPEACFSKHLLRPKMVSPNVSRFGPRSENPARQDNGRQYLLPLKPAYLKGIMKKGG
jgi:hypothetical protein